MNSSVVTRFFGGALLAVAVAGCSPGNGSVADPGASTPVSAPTSSASLSMPPDFPDSIPVRSGPIVVSAATGTGAERTWVVEVIVDDLEIAQRETVEELQGAGFVVVSETQVDQDTWDAVLTRDHYVIMLRVYREADTGELEVRYVVSQGSSGQS